MLQGISPLSYPAEPPEHSPFDFLEELADDEDQAEEVLCSECGFLVEHCECLGPRVQESDIKAEELEPDPLADYTTAFLLLQRFRFANAELIGQLEALQADVTDTKAVLTEHAHKVGPMENDTIVVTVNAAPKKRIWDVGRVVELLPWVSKTPGIVHTVIDDKALMREIKRRHIDESTLGDAVEVYCGTPAVLIRVKVPGVR